MAAARALCKVEGKRQFCNSDSRVESAHFSTCPLVRAAHQAEACLLAASFPSEIILLPLMKAPSPGLKATMASFDLNPDVTTSSVRAVFDS